MNISLDLNVDVLVEEYPQAAGFLADHNVVCIKCGEPYWGTLGELMADKGIEDPDGLVRKLIDYLASGES